MSIRSVIRAFSVLDCFSFEAPRLTLHEICEKLELPKTTTFRLVHTLVDTGYLLQLDDQRYCVSFRVLRLAPLVQSVLDIRDVVRPELRILAESTGETAAISSLNGVERTYLDVVESSSRLKAVVSVGETVKLTKGSVSMVFLAFRPDLPFDEIFTDGDQPGTLAEELAEIRAKGHAFAAADRVAGSAGLAAPIFDLQDSCTHVLSLSGPEVRMIEKRDELAKTLMASAKKISVRLGSAQQ